jgi:hypothetical protein
MALQFKITCHEHHIKEAFMIYIKEVEHTRDLQRSYYQTRNPTYLQQAKQAEVQLDQMTNDFKKRLQGPQPTQLTIEQ